MVRLSVLSAEALAGHPITSAIEVGVALAQQPGNRHREIEPCSGGSSAAVLGLEAVNAATLIGGLAAAWVLKMPLVYRLLLGSIVGSTDAAAVFSVLRSSGLKWPERLTATLALSADGLGLRLVGLWGSRGSGGGNQYRSP